MLRDCVFVIKAKYGPGATCCRSNYHRGGLSTFQLFLCMWKFFCRRPSEHVKARAQELGRWEVALATIHFMSQITDQISFSHVAVNIFDLSVHLPLDRFR